MSLFFNSKKNLTLFDNTGNNKLSRSLPLLSLVLSLLLSVLVTIISLNHGLLSIFQNLFYLPIIFACMFYQKRGFLISLFISLFYFLMIALYSNDQIIITGASVRTIFFVAIAYILFLFSLQRLRAEKNQKKIEEKYRYIDDASLDLIYSYDTQSRFTHANKSLCVLLGLSEEQIIGKTHRELGFPPEQCDEWDKLHKKVLETNSLVTSETATQIGDGELEYYEVSLNPIHNDKGNIIGIAGTTRNISERKKSEIAVLENEQRLQSLVNILQTESESIQQFLDFSLNEAIKLTGSKIGYIYFYDEIKRQFILNSWSKEVMKECSIVNPETCYELDKTGIWGEAVRQRKPIIVNDFRANNPLKKGYPEGHVALTSFITIPIFDGDKIVAVVGVANKEKDYDQTDVLQLTLLMDSVWRVVQRKKYEEALKENEKKLATLFDSMTEMVVLHEVVYDNDSAVNYRIIDCNNSFSIITAIQKEYAVGKLATELYNTETAPYIEQYAAVAVTGIPFEFDTYYPAMDKYFKISVVSPKIGQFATITTDITSMKQINEIIVSKNKELGNYLYIASHDLRSPLVNIQGFGQRIQRDIDSLIDILKQCDLPLTGEERLAKIINEKIPKSLNYIFSSVNKMDSLVNGLLQISRTGRVRMNITRVNMKKLIEDVLLPFNYQIETAKSEIIIGDLPDCYGDAPLLNQMFSNLLGNAIRYKHEERRLVVKISGEAKYKKVIYKIEDNGIGIAERHLEKIWDVFFRVNSKTSPEGEGIGLTIVKTIVEKHRGKIRVESALNEGSSFLVELNREEFTE